MKKPNKPTKVIATSVVAFILTLGLPLLSPASHTASATTNPILRLIRDTRRDELENDADQAGGQSLTDILQSIISIALFIVGILSVIFLIRAGWKYIQSNGDAGKVTTGRLAVTITVTSGLSQESRQMRNSQQERPPEPQ